MIIDRINDLAMKCYSDKYRGILADIQNLIQEIYNNYSKEKMLLPVLKVMLTAMEKDDAVLIGDCLQYGIKPVLENKAVAEIFFDEQFFDIPNVENTIFYYSSLTEEPVLCAKKSSGEIIRLNSQFSPQNEVEQWLFELDIKANTSGVCLFGLGTGLFAEAVLKKLSSNGKLVIYEPNQEIMDYCLNAAKDENADPAEKKIAARINRILSDKRVTLIVESKNKNQFREKMGELFRYPDLAGLKHAKHNNYERIFAESCKYFYQELNYYMSVEIMNQNTNALFRQDFVDNIFKNMYLFNNSNMCDEIGNILPKDIPVIIVSAGPSLDKNIDLLHQTKGHCLIFAVDSAVKYLLKKDIIPDLTITIDAKKPISNFADIRAKALPCLFDVTANPEIFKNHIGRVFLFNNSDYYAITCEWRKRSDSSICIYAIS